MKHACTLLILASLSYSGCASECKCHQPVAPSAAQTPQDAPAAAVTPAGAHAANAPDQAMPAADPSAPGTAPAAVESLPEVVVRNVGLHIGGGPNDEPTKAPFKRAIEAHFDELRRCYAKTAEPGKGGVIGVDLRIGREGGRAEVSEPRTGMRGQEFRECVIGVFRSVEFERPQKPTVLSYSIEYAIVTSQAR